MTLFSLLRTLSAGYFNQHRTRSLLVVLSIALGVAAMVATQALSQSLKSGVQQGVNPLADLADLLITRGQVGVPSAMAEELEKAAIPGLARATPFVLWRMSLADLDNKIVWVVGYDWAKAGKLTDLASKDNPLGVTVRLDPLPTSSPGDWLAGAFRMLSEPLALVSDNLARELDRSTPPLRSFRLRNSGKTPRVARIGTVDFASSSLPLKDSLVVILNLADASAVCFPEVARRAEQPVHQIGVKVVPGADLEQVRLAVKAWLGSRAEVQTVDASRELVSDVTAGLEIGMALGGAGALVIGMFLVYNILSVSVAERRHDIGILRSVGATRGQIAGLFVGEALIMGLSGSLLGLPVGWTLAWLALQPLAGVVSELLVPIDRAVVSLPLWLMVVAVCAGTLVAVLAALVPALQAAGEEPADAVRRVPRKSPFLTAIFQISLTALLIAAGFGLSNYRQLLPPRIGMFAGIVCLLLGGLALTPFLASLVGRVIQPLFRHFFGLEGRLAADNLVRTPGRTGIVIAALAATGGLMVQTAGFLKSSRDAIHDWVEQKIAADLFVTAGSGVTSGGTALSMQEDMQSKLLSIPGVEAVLPVRFMRLDYDDPIERKNRIVFLLGIDTQGFVARGGDRPLARSMGKLARLAEPGTVAVSENFAALYGVKVGDRITIPGREKEIQVEVVGTVTDYTWNRGTILMDRVNFLREYADRQVDVFDLFLKPGTDIETIRKEILDRHGSEQIFVVSRPELHEEVRSTLQKVYSLAYAQQTVVGLVALLGVVSALFISVLQRRRELGLLRAVGASRGQILRSVLAEAVLMGVIGAVVGFGIGVLLEWYVINILLLDESGFTFPLRIPWLEAGLVSLASVVLATLAGLWPAYHATTLRIPEAIAYE